MAYEETLKTITLLAAADFSASQFLAVKVDSNGRAALAGAGDLAIGILQNDPDAIDKAATVGTEGVTKAVLGATVAAGAEVQTDAAGKIITLAAGERVGICLTGGDADEIQSIYISK